MFLIQFFILPFWREVAFASGGNLVSNSETYRTTPYDVSIKHHKSCPCDYGYNYNVYMNYVLSVTETRYNYSLR